MDKWGQEPFPLLWEKAPVPIYLRPCLKGKIMSRFKLYIEYEGTRFRGGQIQKNARSVQGELSFVIKKVFYSAEFDFQGSGRTDAGVHALRQVAHLEVKTKLTTEIIRMKINDELP